MRFQFDRKFIIVAVALITILACVLGFKYFKSAMTAKFVAAAMPTSTTVTGEKVSEVFWEPLIFTVGSARSEQSVDIAPEVSGRVTKILFSSGQMVKQGDLLVQLNPDVLLAQLDSAHAKYEYAKLTYERQLELLNRNVGQQQSVDSAKADMDEAKASIEQIKAQLDQLAIKAPFSGVLGLRYVNVGQYVSPGAALVNLQSTDPMEVDFVIPENYLKNVSVGLKVTVTSDAYPNVFFDGEIFAVNSEIDPASRGLTLRANVNNKDGYLVPSMFVKVLVHLKGGSKKVAIPQNAMNYSQVGDYVYVAESGKAVKRYVVAGERRDDVIAIESGLKPGETIVTTGQLKLHDGAPINLEAPEKADKEDNSEKNNA